MQRARILFVDDDVLNQWLLTEVLIAAGFDVNGVCRGGAAVELLNQGQDFDVLLTECDLPDGMSGFELAQFWRAVQPDRPVIYTSDSPQDLTGLLRSDEGFVLKHVGAPNVLHVISVLLDEVWQRPRAQEPDRLLFLH